MLEVFFFHLFLRHSLPPPFFFCIHFRFYSLLSYYTRLVLCLLGCHFKYHAGSRQYYTVRCMPDRCHVIGLQHKNQRSIEPQSSPCWLTVSWYHCGSTFWISQCHQSLRSLSSLHLLACQPIVIAGESDFRDCVPCYTCDVNRKPLTPFVCRIWVLQSVQ